MTDTTEINYQKVYNWILEKDLKDTLNCYHAKKLKLRGGNTLVFFDDHKRFIDNLTMIKNYPKGMTIIGHLFDAVHNAGVSAKQEEVKVFDTSHNWKKKDVEVQWKKLPLQARAQKHNVHFTNSTWFDHHNLSVE